MGIPRVFGQQKPAVGVYRDEPDRDDAASQSSAMSLHEDVDFRRAEDEALPPPYSDDPDAAPDSGAALVAGDEDSLPGNVEPGQFVQKQGAKGSAHTWLSTTHTSDPVLLQKFVNDRIYACPMPTITIHGEHTETRDDGKNKKKEKKVDFDIRLDVTNTISRRRTHSSEPMWAEVSTVENAYKTYRGTISKSMDKRSRADTESAREKPSLEEWCHLFCASSSKLKSFTIRHWIENRNDAILRDKITEIVRATNYRGQITVSFQLNPRTITMQTPHIFNKMRHNKYIYWLFIILQLWIITWPLLFCMTKRWEVVYVKWPYRKQVPMQGETESTTWVYAKESEQDWAKRYRYTIQQGVLSKAINGTMIDYVAQDERWHEEERQRQERERAAHAAEPQGGFVGGALSLMRGVSNIVREQNDVRGWGHDT